MKVWLLAGPFYQYEEDVKDLARKNDLRIIDSRYTAPEEYGDQLESKPPKVKIKKEFQPEKPTKAKKEKVDDSDQTE